MRIRKYASKDRQSVEQIQFGTYFLGKSADQYIDDRRIIVSDIRYYLEKEPHSCFVAEDKGKIVGYVLGCLDDKKHTEGVMQVIAKTLIPVIRSPFMSKKDRRFALSRMKMIMDALLGRSEDAKFNVPKDSGHIHINLLPEARGKGIGTKLIDEFCRYARSKGVKMIHADSFDTRLNPNKGFWKKNGFTQFCRVKTSFWKEYYPDEDISVVCYQKKL